MLRRCFGVLVAVWVCLVLAVGTRAPALAERVPENALPNVG